MSADFELTGNVELDERQREINGVLPSDFLSYIKQSTESLGDLLEVFPTFARLESAFEGVYRELRETKVVDINKPAIWYIYNMGLIVKTAEKCFSIDLHHRRAHELAPLLDFALITHNHGDHYTMPFLSAMDEVQGKTIIQNFFENSGAVHGNQCGFIKEEEHEFNFGSIKVITGCCDHNPKLVKFTIPFEIHIGDFTLFHSGDCFNHNQLHPTRQPDLWVLHPYCGMDPLKGCREMNHPPKRIVIAHLQELAHARDMWRWTFADGLRVKNSLIKAGYDAIMPLWGERLM